MSFKQKVVLVTGAARGIGREYCHRLAALGAAVMAVDINACDQTVELVKSAGGRAIAGKVDVTDMASIEAAIDIVSLLCRPDLVVLSDAHTCDPVPTLTLLVSNLGFGPVTPWPRHQERRPSERLPSAD